MNAESSPTPISVLAIDDEPQIQRLLTIALEPEGYRVTTAGTGQAGLVLAARARQEIFLLDLGLPDMNGVDVLRQLREWTQAPIIILTVRESAAEKIEALDCGADDYVTKPFNTGELLARMRASLRRYHKTRADEPVFHSGELTVDLARRMVEVSGRPVKLTPKEYDLLRLFIQHAGKALTHRYILREVWGASHEEQTQYLRVYMARLREKLEQDPSARPLFLTEGGVGYRMTGG